MKCSNYKTVLIYILISSALLVDNLPGFTLRASSEIALLTLTNSIDAVEDVASLALTAVGAHQVYTTVTFTDLLRALTLINIWGYKQQKAP